MVEIVKISPEVHNTNRKHNKRKSRFKGKKIFIIGILLFFTLLFVSLYKTFSILSTLGYKTVYVVHVEDPILYDNLDIDRLYDFLKNYRGDALILYINSPGGGLEVYKIVKALKSIEVPTVCYVKYYGTSAAYWLCSLADYIVAEEHSIVGSVGGLMMVTDISGLLNKTGINVSVIKTGKYKDTPNSLRPLSKEEYELLKRKLKLFVDLFRDDVLSNRNITNVSRVLDAEWFLGLEAKDLGLIDEYGDLEKAINATAKLLNTTQDRIIIRHLYFGQEESFLDKLIESYAKAAINRFLTENTQVIVL